MLSDLNNDDSSSSRLLDKMTKEEQEIYRNFQLRIQQSSSCTNLKPDTY